MVSTSSAPPAVPSTRSSDIVLALRGQRDHRPNIDPLLAGGLRSWLEDGLSDVARDLDPSTPMLLSPRTIVSGPLVAVPPLIALARSILIGNLVTLRLSLGEVHHPMDDALSALEADHRQTGLVEAIHELDQDRFAQLAAEIEAHDTVLARHLSQLPSAWLPRSNVRISAALAGGRIMVNAVANVALGAPARDIASVCFLDVTTSSLDDNTLRRLGVIGLIETLRSGAPPLRVASLSTGTGDTAIIDVTDEILAQAVADVVAAAQSRGGLS